MSMQDTFNSVQNYLGTLQVILDRVNLYTNCLSTLYNNLYKDLPYTSGHNANYFSITKDKLCFISIYNSSNTSQLNYVRSSTKTSTGAEEIHVLVPRHANDIGTAEKNYVTLDELMYISIHLESFNKHVINEMLRYSFEIFNSTVKNLRDQAVVDLI